MSYVTIDENRFQIAYSKWDDIGEKVDITSPSYIHSLKTDYAQFEGEEQWEISIEGIRLQKIAEIKSERNKQIYGIAYVNEGTADEQALVLTESNRDILSRKAQVVEQFGSEANIIFTGSDLPQIKLGDEIWLEVAVTDCLSWSMQVEFLSQKAFNREKKSQDSINTMRDEVIAETKTLQEFIDFDFVAEYNINLKAAVADHTKFAYPEQYHNEDI